MEEREGAAVAFFGLATCLTLASLMRLVFHDHGLS